jgi:DNA-binding transcriptional LysR family regulator
MDQLRAVRVFLKVVAEGSFAGAARALDLAPAVVTRVVAELEAHLGTRLLQRTTRRIALTDAGAAYRERVQRIVAEFDDADAEAGQSTLRPGGTLRVLCPPAFAAHQLAAMLPRFRERFPQLGVELTASGAVEAADENFDVSIVSVGAQPMTGDFVVCPRARGLSSTSWWKPSAARSATRGWIHRSADRAEEAGRFALGERVERLGTFTYRLRAAPQGRLRPGEAKHLRVNAALDSEVPRIGFGDWLSDVRSWQAPSFSQLASSERVKRSRGKRAALGPDAMRACRRIPPRDIVHATVHSPPSTVVAVSTSHAVRQLRMGRLPFGRGRGTHTSGQVPTLSAGGFVRGAAAGQASDLRGR